MADPKATYTSHPIMNYGMGRFKFQKGTLTLESKEDIDEFEKLWKEQPPVEQRRVKKIDLAAAEKISLEARGIEGGATKTIDSSTGDRKPQTPTGTGSLESQQAKQEAAGTVKPEDLGFVSQPQTDMNKPVDVTKTPTPTLGGPIKLGDKK